MPTLSIADLKAKAYRYSVVILGCALAGAVWLGIAHQIRSDYDKNTAAIETELNSQTLVLASHVVRTLKELDRALLIIRDYVELERKRNGGQIPWGRIRIPTQDVLSGVAMQIGLIDETGRFRVSSVPIDPFSGEPFKYEPDGIAGNLVWPGSLLQAYMPFVWSVGINNNRIAPVYGRAGGEGAVEALEQDPIRQIWPDYQFEPTELNLRYYLPLVFPLPPIESGDDSTPPADKTE